MKKKTRNEKQMTFLEHLEELRWRLIKCIVAVVVLSLGSYFFSEQIMDLLTLPFPETLIFIAPAEGFLIRLKISLFAGIIIGLPILFYQIWQFVVPGLLDKERKYVPVVVFISTACFLVGALFAYSIMIPFAMRFFMKFQTPELVANIRIKDYLSFVTTMILVFGIVFEMPILSYFLTRIGLITAKFLRSKRRYAIVLILVMAALLTPPDVVSQLFLGGPMVLLYEVSIIVSTVAARKSKKQEGNESSEN